MTFSMLFSFLSVEFSSTKSDSSLSSIIFVNIDPFLLWDWMFKHFLIEDLLNTGSEVLKNFMARSKLSFEMTNGFGWGSLIGELLD